MVFQDIPTDFASNKLIQGAGPICLFVLDCLATQAMKISKVYDHLLTCLLDLCPGFEF